MAVKNKPDTGFKPGVSGNPNGRPKGAVNKTTALLKDAILKAAEAAGNKVGEDGMVSYLTEQAQENPGPFMSLLGKVLPLQLAGPDDEDGNPKEIVFRVVYPTERD